MPSPLTAPLNVSCLIGSTKMGWDTLEQEQDSSVAPLLIYFLHWNNNDSI